MDALSSEERLRRAELFARLTDAAGHVDELPNGFAVRFPSTANIWMIAAEFVTLESRCCPFLSFSLGVEGDDDGLMSLCITGRPGVKEFLATELHFSGHAR